MNAKAIYGTYKTLLRKIFIKLTALCAFTCYISFLSMLQLKMFFT